MRVYVPLLEYTHYSKKSGPSQSLTIVRLKFPQNPKSPLNNTPPFWHIYCFLFCMEQEYILVLTFREHFKVMEREIFPHSRENLKNALKKGQKWADKDPSVYNFNVRMESKDDL